MVVGPTTPDQCGQNTVIVHKQYYISIIVNSLADKQGGKQSWT